MNFEGRSAGPNRTEFGGTMVYDADSKRFTIRVDDTNNPEFWMSVSFSTDFLRQIQQPNTGNVFDELFKLFEQSRDQWALEARGKWVGLTLDDDPIFGEEEQEVYEKLKGRKTYAIVQKIDRL